MPKDHLLTEAFFALDQISWSEMNLANQNLNAFDQLIKQELYPHLSETRTPTYYQGRNTFSALNQFVYQEGSLLHSQQFKVLQSELSRSVNHIRFWGIRNQIDGVESLTVFLKKLEQPSDGMTLLYGDGKRLVEKIAVLLGEPLIKLEERQQIMVSLMADKELEHCIAGCYSRLASAASQLQENLDGDIQIKQWLRSYSRETASSVAARRPFGGPDTYQVLICKASNSAVEHNLFHANNYLLMQAKFHGFPISIEQDQGASELGNRLPASDKRVITDAYIKDMEQHINAKGFINYLSGKFHESFTTIISTENGFVEKSNLILSKLNILGEDTWFKTNKVDLNEIFDDEGQLKGVNALKITVAQRLIDRNLIRGYEVKNLFHAGRTLEYHEFSPEIALTWLWLDNQRKPLLELIQGNRWSELVPHRLESEHLSTSIALLHSHFIKNTQSLLKVIKVLPANYRDFFFNPVSFKQMAYLLKKSDSVQLFAELLLHIPDPANAKLLITACGDEFVKKMLTQGLFQADIKKVLPGLSINYLSNDYSENSRQEALQITQGLIKKLIDYEFKNFARIEFLQLPHAYLNELDFSLSNLRSAVFYQAVCRCKFDGSDLYGAVFFSSLEKISFKSTDIRSVIFHSAIPQPYLEINLDNTLLSTDSFKALRMGYVTQFVGTNLKEVNFQDREIKFLLQGLDFTGANLESLDLSHLKLTDSIWLGSNLQRVNLLDTDLTNIRINSRTKLQMSILNIGTVEYIYTMGFKNFEGCNIHISKDFDEEFVVFFHRANFKNAQFIGQKFYVGFKQSDLSYALFTPKLLETSTSRMLLGIHAKESQLDGATFRRVQFGRPAKFIRSALTIVNFDEVVMSASSLFSFYQMGQRDFMGIKALMGGMPKELKSFPVLEAYLTKESFIYLYRRGLRDFRGSNLRSFYLGQVLTQQAISEIDLKLEGAKYKSSPLVCTSSNRNSRAIGLPCGVHYVLQKTSVVNEQEVSLADVKNFVKVTQTRFSIKEVMLGTKPLYLFSEAVNEVNFYLAYRPDEDTFTKLHLFTQESSIELNRSARRDFKLRYHLAKQFNDVSVPSEFVKNIGQIGFSDVRLNYYQQQTQITAIQLINGVPVVVQHMTQSQQILGMTKFRNILNTVPINPAKNYNKGEYRARLDRISLDIKRRMGSSGQGGGGKYVIGAGVIRLIGSAMKHPGTPEVKFINEEEKIELKQLARAVARDLGSRRLASERAINSIISVAEQCIDRGECSTEEQVMQDVSYHIYMSTPGNPYLWRDVKKFFINVGDFFSDRFDAIKDYFISLNNRGSTELRGTRVIGSPFRPRTGEIRRMNKRELMGWYESPLLMRLIKDIELVFDVFGYDMHRDEDFSEEVLAGMLRDMWQALANYGVGGNQSSSEFVLSVFGNASFIEEVSGISKEDPLFSQQLLFPTSKLLANTVWDDEYLLSSNGNFSEEIDDISQEDSSEITLPTSDFLANTGWDEYATSDNQSEEAYDISQEDYSSEFPLGLTQIEETRFNLPRRGRYIREIQIAEPIMSGSASRHTGILQAGLESIRSTLNQLFSVKAEANSQRIDSIQERADAYYDQLDRMKITNKKSKKAKCVKVEPEQSAHPSHDHVNKRSLLIGKQAKKAMPPKMNKLEFISHKLSFSSKSQIVTLKQVQDPMQQFIGENSQHNSTNKHRNPIRVCRQLGH